MTDIMLDLETLATSPDSVILTFGAVKFDPFDCESELEHGLYFRIDVDQQIALGRNVDQGTVAWWGQQNETVREEALGENDRVSLENFTKELNRFVVGAERIWAQGPVFDIVILENLYRQLLKPTPWPYYVIRDSRTLLKALGDTRQPGQMLHNALADCVSQAQAIQNAVKRYKLTQL
jgi:exodeoxyribonuclease VIII